MTYVHVCIGLLCLFTHSPCCRSNVHTKDCWIVMFRSKISPKCVVSRMTVNTRVLLKCDVLITNIRQNCYKITHRWPMYMYTGWPDFAFLPEQSEYSRFFRNTLSLGGATVIFFRPCWNRASLSVIITTPRSSNLVKNFLFYWVIAPCRLSFSGGWKPDPVSDRSERTINDKLMVNPCHNIQYTIRNYSYA